jgi:hypothetical protein
MAKHITPLLKKVHVVCVIALRSFVDGTWASRPHFLLALNEEAARGTGKNLHRMHKQIFGQSSFKFSAKRICPLYFHTAGLIRELNYRPFGHYSSPRTFRSYLIKEDEKGEKHGTHERDKKFTATL